MVGCQAPSARRATEARRSHGQTWRLRSLPARNKPPCNQFTPSTKKHPSGLALPRHSPSPARSSAHARHTLATSSSQSRDAAAPMASPTSSASLSRSVSASSSSLPSRHSTPVATLSPAEQEKEALVRAAIDNDDVAALVHLATTSHGLVSDSLRRTACRLLLPFALCRALG